MNSFWTLNVTIRFNPLAAKYPEWDTSLVPNFPSQVTNYQVWANQSTRYRPIQVHNQWDSLYYTIYFSKTIFKNESFLHRSLDTNALVFIPVKFPDH